MPIPQIDETRESIFDLYPRYDVCDPNKDDKAREGPCIAVAKRLERVKQSPSDCFSMWPKKFKS